MKKTQDIAALFFMVCIGVLTIISVLSIWDVLVKDVLLKSFQTIGLLAIVVAVVTTAARFMDSPSSGEEVVSIPQINPIFSQIRHFTLIVLIVSSVLLALFGVLAVWEIFSTDMIYKTLSSIALMAFASFVVVLVCLEREKREVLQKKISGWWVLFFILTFFWFVGFLA